MNKPPLDNAQYFQVNIYYSSLPCNGCYTSLCKMFLLVPHCCSLIILLEYLVCAPGQGGGVVGGEDGCQGGGHAQHHQAGPQALGLHSSGVAVP